MKLIVDSGDYCEEVDVGEVDRKQGHQIACLHAVNKGVAISVLIRTTAHLDDAGTIHDDDFFCVTRPLLRQMGIEYSELEQDEEES